MPATGPFPVGSGHTVRLRPPLTGTCSTASISRAVPSSKPPVPPTGRFRHRREQQRHGRPVFDAERRRQPTHIAVDRERASQYHRFADGRRHPPVDHGAHRCPRGRSWEARRSGGRDRRRRGPRATGSRSRPWPAAWRRNATITTLRSPGESLGEPGVAPFEGRVPGGGGRPCRCTWVSLRSVRHRRPGGVPDGDHCAWATDGATDGSRGIRVDSARKRVTFRVEPSYHRIEGRQATT